MPRLSNEAVGLPRARRATGSRAPELVAVPKAEIPDAPEDLGRAGLGAWRAAFSSAPWLVTEADHSLVEEWARMADERAELRLLLAERGPVAEGSQGQFVTAPWVAQLRALDASLVRLAQLLGIGPRSRAQLGQKLTSGPGERVLSDAERRLALAHRGRKS